MDDTTSTQISEPSVQRKSSQTTTTSSTTATPSSTETLSGRKSSFRSGSGIGSGSETKAFISEDDKKSDRKKDEISREDCKKAFDAFDTDASGFIDEEEFWKLVNYEGLQSSSIPKMSREEAKLAFQQLDTSKDGTLSFEEFYLWMTGKAQPRGSIVVPQGVPMQLDRIKSSLQKDTLIDHLQQFGMKETYFCEICFSYELRPKGFQLRTCGHQFCKECLKEYFQSKISDGQVYLRCFANLNIDGKTIPCDTKMAEDDLLANVDDATREKYARFKANVDNPHTRQCSKCNNSQQGDPDKPIITCSKCGWNYCYTHGDQHVDSSCAEYERKHRAENLKNRALISKISKPCPKCKSPIQKRSGCNHMKCPQCNAAFCWLCLEEIEDTTYPEHFKATNIRSGCRGKQFEQVSCTQSVFIFIVSLWILFFIAPVAAALALAMFLACFVCVMLNFNCTPSCRQLFNTFRSMYDCWMGVLCYGSVCIWTLVCCIPLSLLICLARMCGLEADGEGRDEELERQAELEAQAQMEAEERGEPIEARPPVQQPQGSGVGLAGDQLV
eukprot:TRINITY_DN5059_c0_g1_i7.p1 TRINITY_DN5059_c0_g1~~TRINITY_DN5059_c0_g1_i7.p1  ORF type:complete len:556 (+),score=66.98 TRINITY_DN5059_c0_g1_i7:135-1802(+)